MVNDGWQWWIYNWLVVYLPLWKIWVNWDDDIPNIWEIKNVPNHQADKGLGQCPICSHHLTNKRGSIIDLSSTYVSRWCPKSIYQGKMDGWIHVDLSIRCWISDSGHIVWVYIHPCSGNPKLMDDRFDRLDVSGLIRLISIPECGKTNHTFTVACVGKGVSTDTVKKMEIRWN